RPATNAISPELIRDIGRSIISVEERQIAGASGLASKARLKAAGIASALRSEGIVVPSERSSLDDAAAMPGSGGPFVPVPEDADFDRSFADLDLALDELQDLSDAAASLPLGAPLADAPVSSTFGVRADPFLGRSALHTGIDFVAETGTRVTVATAGTVVAAGTNGGYGIMVEVDHGGGVVTRYAHLSGVFIAVGDRLGAGDAVGMVGSTGRSTGPHLHYEIRRDGDAVDPARFLRAGQKIRALL
ncbi:MAG: M23 family metallopeptidase, partial [Rhizobiaceae bacterium]|nr:M23 family metallopeptidase [Rhizobiaceae bacterium]